MINPAVQSAFSSHPVAAHAAGECIGALLESGVTSPEIAILVVTRESAVHLAEMADLLRETIAPRAILGAAFPGVFAGSDRAVDRPGVAILAWSPLRLAPSGRLVAPRRTAARSLHLGGLEELRAMWDADPSWADSTAVVVADPFSVPWTDWHAATSTPGAPRRLLGGYASGATRPGATWLLCDDGVRRDGLVVLRTSASIDVVASSRSVTVGPTRTVTVAEGAELLELDGVGALEACESVLADLGVLVDAPSALRTGMLRLTVSTPGREGRAASDTGSLSWSDGSAKAWPEPGTGALRCGRPVGRGDRVALTLTDTDAAAADLGQRLGSIGWPGADDGLLAFADVDGTELVDDAAVLAANSALAPAVGVVTEGVLVPGDGGFGIGGGVLAVGVLRGGHDPEPARFSGG